MVARRLPSGSRMARSPLSGRLGPMRVDVSCRKCGQRRRLELGDPGDTPVDEFIHRVKERLAHQPSFECFGGHPGLAPPLPRFWGGAWTGDGPRPGGVWGVVG